MVTPTTRIPDTAYGVLGMLTFGESSGYDLAKAIDGSIGFFWAPAKSQLYAELRRLVELGWATEREVEQTDRPDKRIYRITDEGERMLRDWLDAGPPRSSRSRARSCSGCSSVTSRARRPPASSFGSTAASSQELLGVFRGIERELREADVERDLTLTYGLAYVRAAIRWCDRTERELDGSGPTAGGR